MHIWATRIGAAGLLIILALEIYGDDGALAQPAAPSVVGTWRGSYVCAQGKTGLTLTIEQQTGRQFSGTFHFYPTVVNAQAKEGCFSVEGQIDPQRRVTVKALAWITRPTNYVTVDLDGYIAAAGREMAGAVIGQGDSAALCTRFALSREATRGAPARPCRRETASLAR